MRIAILPIIGFKNILGESDYLLYSDMIKRFTAEGHYVYFCLPSESQSLVPPAPARVAYLFEDTLGVWYDQEVHVPRSFMEWFNPRTAWRPVDVILTSRASAVPVMQRLLWDYRFKDDLVPCVIFEPKVASFSGTHQTVTEIELLGRTLGYAIGWPLFSTAEEIHLAIEVARRYLSPTMVQKFQQRAEIVPIGIDCDLLDSHLEQARTKFETFTVFFGGRLNLGAKRADKMIEMYDQFFRYGRDVDVLLCSPKEESFIGHVMEKRGASEIKLVNDCGRDEFLKHAAQAHVYLNTSRFEGFSVGFLEQMYLMVSIVPNLPWCRAMLKDAFDRYPYVYNTNDEAGAMLRWVHEHYDEARQKTLWIREWIRSNYSVDVISNKVLECLCRKVAEHRNDGLMSVGNLKLLSDTAALMPEQGLFTLDEFWDKMRQTAVSDMKNNPKRGQMNRFQTYRWLCDQFGDDCEIAVPRFRRCRE